MQDAMGVEALAERARRELAATGEIVRERTVETSSELTAWIARLARDGPSNPEIGSRLFISAGVVPLTSCGDWPLADASAPRRPHPY
jgi:ATP/maltotriose-dependent transcriptional regulator MalT